MDNSDTRRSVHRPRDQRVSSGRVLIVASKVPRDWHTGEPYVPMRTQVGMNCGFLRVSRFGTGKTLLPGRVRGEDSNAAALLNGTETVVLDDKRL
jgi:hypothetical protein